MGTAHGGLSGHVHAAAGRDDRDRGAAGHGAGAGRLAERSAVGRSTATRSRSPRCCSGRARRPTCWAGAGCMWRVSCCSRRRRCGAGSRPGPGCWWRRAGCRGWARRRCSRRRCRCSARSYQGRQRSAALGVWGAVSGAAAAVGPLARRAARRGARLAVDLLRQPAGERGVGVADPAGGARVARPAGDAGGLGGYGDVRVLRGGDDVRDGAGRVGRLDVDAHRRVVRARGALAALLRPRRAAGGPSAARSRAAAQAGVRGRDAGRAGLQRGGVRRDPVSLDLAADAGGDEPGAGRSRAAAADRGLGRGVGARRQAAARRPGADHRRRRAAAHRGRHVLPGRARRGHDLDGRSCRVWSWWASVRVWWRRRSRAPRSPPCGPNARAWRAARSTPPGSSGTRSASPSSARS